MVKLVPFKRGFRCLGVAESFSKSFSRSVLAGVVMRRDLIIDGVAFSFATVGGLDATRAVLEIYQRLNRDDISVIMVHGCIISWFNFIDVDEIYRETGRPAMCLTYEESPGIEQYIRKYFPQDAELRLRIYRKLGPREKVYIRRVNKYVYVRYAGLTQRSVREVLNAFTLSGSVPEPLRVARLVARAALKLFVAEESSKVGDAFDKPTQNH